MTATVTPLHAGQPWPPGAYPGAVACAAAGITYRRLDYWDVSDVVRPSVSAAQGSGTARAYSAEDIVRLAIARTMLDVGLSLAYVRATLPRLEGEDVWLNDRHGELVILLDVAAVRRGVLARLEAMAA